MKKFLLNLLLLAAMVLPFATQAQMTLTVHNGTATNSYVPVYGLYTDAFLKCQSVYPAAELGVMTGGQITGLTYYLSSMATDTWDMTSFRVYLMEVAGTTLSSYASLTNATMVYQGTLSGTSSTMAITFTTPYIYQGGNLLIAVYNIAEGDYSSCSFYGETVTGASIQGYDYDDIDDAPAGVQNFLPKTTFNYVPGQQSCPMVSGLTVSNITDESADISWTPGGTESQWEIRVSPAVDGDTLISVSSTSYSFSNMNSNTQYTVTVKAICSSTDQSYAVGTTFKTLCGLMTQLPFTETFENQNTTSSSSSNFIDCWHLLNNGTSYPGYPYVANSSSYNHTPNGSKGLYWYGSTTTGSYGDYQIVVLPAIDTDTYTMNTLQLKFWAKSSSASYFPVFYTGVMTDPTDPTTFQVIDTIAIGNTTQWTEFASDFDNFSGYGMYAAIKAVRPAATWYAYVDDITLRETPACPEVNSISVTSTGYASASISWTTLGTANISSYEIELSEADAQSTPQSFTTNDMSYMFTGLSTGTEYLVKVRTNCSSVDGEWDSTTFTTMALPCAELDPTTADTTTIGTGTTGISGCLAYSSWGNTATQQIWTATELAAAGMTSGAITGIDLGFTACTSYNKEITIFIGNSNVTSISSATLVSPTSHQQVYGPVVIPSGTSGYQHYEFDSPFQWDGSSSIMLTVLVNQSGSSQTSSSGMTGYYTSASNKAAYRYQDSNPFTAANINAGNAGSTFSYRPNINFYMGDCLAYATCVAPNAQVDSVDQTSASISWAPGYQETSWTVDYRADGESTWTTAETSTSNTNTTISGLSPNTVYQVRVGSACSDTTVYATVSFRTACGALTLLPYVEDFESQSTGSTSSHNFAVCWHHLNNGSSYFGYPYISASTTYNHTPNGGKGLYWYNTTTTGTYGDYQIIVLPELDTTVYPMNTLQLKFWAKSSSTSYSPSFTVGVMADPTDATSFQQVGTVNVGNSTNWTEYTTDLTSFNGNGAYVAIRALRPSSSWYAYVDDITLRQVPQCAEIAGLTVGNVGYAAADVDWHTQGGTSEPAGFEVELTEIDATSGPQTPTTFTTTTSDYTFTNLSVGTQYKVRVRTDCSGEYSAWDSITFNTMSLPCAQLDPTTADTTIIGTGTTGISGCLAYSSWGNTATQQIWTATELAAAGMQAGAITGIDLGFTACSSYNKELTIYIANSNVTSISSATLVSPANHQLAYGPVVIPSGTSGYQHYEFDAPFSWDGTSSIMITTTMNQSGSSQTSSSGMTGYYTSATNKAAYRYQDSNPFTASNINSGNAGSTFSYRPNIRFYMGECLAYATCVAPIASLDSYDATSATISWVPGYQETSWDVDYRTMPNGSWNSAEVATSNTTTTITNLSANTLYEVRVGAVCSDTTIYTTLNFRTACGDLTVLPYIMDFESETTGTSSTGSAFVPCWNRLNNGTSYGGYPYVSSSSTYNHTTNGTKGLYWYNTTTTGTYGDYQCLVLPAVDTTIYPINTLQLKFWAKASGTSYNPIFYVGVMGDPDDVSTFQGVDTFYVAGSTVWTEYEANFAQFAGTGYRAAIMTTRPASSWYAYVDDITLEPIPGCPHVVDITLDSVSGTDALIHWTEIGSSTSWKVEYGTQGFVLGTGTVSIEQDTNILISNLNGNTAYDVYITAMCDGGDSSSTMQFTFRTSCSAITQLPWSEGFEGMPAGSSTADLGIPCWARLDNAGQNHFGYVGSISSWPNGAHTGTGFIYYYLPLTANTHADYIYTILPEIDNSVYDMDDLMVSFWGKMNSTSTTGHIIVGVMSNRADSTSFVPCDTVTISGDTYQHVEAYLTGYTGTGSSIALKFHRASETHYFFLDDFIIEEQPDCPPVSNIALAGLDTNEITLTWSENGNATSWTVEYGAVGFTQGNGTQLTATSLPFTVTGLNANTSYDFIVTPDCSGVAPSRRATFTTANRYYSLPFSCDFEDTTVNNAWTISNGSVDNKWVIGTAEHNLGTHALYISDNNGTSSSYSGALETVYSYVDLMFDTIGQYAYSFDWKCNGESSFDYLRVALVSGSESLVGGATTPTSFSSTSLPSGWISLDGNTKLNLSSTWTTQSGTVNVSTPGVYHMVFAWHNDGSVYNTPAACVDNVEIMRLSCSSPLNITSSNLSQNGATISWTEPGNASQWEYQFGNNAPVVVSNAQAVLTGLSASTQYTFRVRSICGAGDTSLWESYSFRTPCGAIALPYTEDFESETAGSSTTGSAFVNCWTRLNNGTSYGGYPYVSSSTTYNHTTGGTKGLYWYNTTTTGTYGDYQIIVLPPIDSATNASALQLSFWAKASSSSYNPVFKVGVMTDPNTPSTFVGVDTIYINGNTTFAEYEVLLSTYTGTGKYVAIKADRPTSSWYAYVDDITLDYIPTCPKVQALHATNASASSIDIAWTDPTTGLGWQVEYGPAGFTHGNGTMLFVTNPMATLTGLTALTSYDAYVRHICSSTDTSIWEMMSATSGLCDNGYTAQNFDSTMSNTTTSYGPAYAYYNYSFSQTIIDSAYLEGLGDITAFAFNPSTTTAGTYYTNCEVYLTPTTMSTISSAVDMDSTSVRVFNGDLSFTSTGWQVFGFDTTYTWDGSSNLILTVVRHHGTYLSGCDFNAVSGSGTKMFYGYSDSYNPTASSLSSYSGTTSSSNTYPKYQLISCNGSAICHAPALGAANVTYNTATVNWNGNSNSYEVSYKASTSASWSTPVAVNAMTYTFTGLAPETAYNFRVRQDCDTLGYSDWSMGSFITNELPCFAPSNLTASNVQGNSVQLNWTAGSNETQWNVHVFNTTYDETTHVTATSATITGLTAGVQYYAAVSALCGNGDVESDYSDTISFTTAICEPVTNVTASVNGTSVTIDWTPGSNNNGQWEIEYGLRGFSQGEGTMVQVTSHPTTINNLYDETDYQAYVRAICGSNYVSTWSNVVEFTTGRVGVSHVEGGMNISIYPNPATGATTISLSGVNGLVNIAIVDMNGRTVLSDAMECQGDCVKKMNVANLAQGAYFVRIYSDEVNTVKKLIVR